jgi:heavy metal efflux system protein
LTAKWTCNGFSQITAVFDDNVDIYFARQQINERLIEAKENLPQGAEPRMGPVATGLGEIYMWTVHYRRPSEGAPVVDGKAGWQSDGTYLTPEGERLATEIEQLAYLRTVQDWIIRPQLRTIPGIAGVDSLGGFQKQYHVQPDPAKLIGLDLSFGDVATAIENNNLNRGASYVEQNGEAYAVRSAGRLENIKQIGDVVVATRSGIPVRVKDLADVKVGRDIRTGSASENGEETVIGTALMRIGENSRTVAAMVDAKMKEINTTLPPSVEARTVLNRTLLVDATIKTVSKNLAEGAILVIFVLFLLLGNFRAALITALVIPIAMLLTATGMVQSGISANLMSLGALDFGLIVDGAVIIAENSLRHLAERQHAFGRPLTETERLSTIIGSAEEMIKPSVFGQAIIILVYVPLLTFSGIEGKMFEPMALTVIIALAAAFVLSLTFVPAMIAIIVTGGIHEKENRFVHWMKLLYEPALKRAIRRPLTVVTGAVALFIMAGLLFTRPSQVFIPTLDEKSIAMQAARIPGTSLSQSQAMQLTVEKTIRKFPQVSVVFSKTGTAELATDPMPPNLPDSFVMLKPREEWPDPELTKDELQRQIEEALRALAGNTYEFSQPIQLRFNELIAGVRADIAVKVFGEEFEPMLRAANQLASLLRGTNGAEDVKVEQAMGLPFLDIEIDKAENARLGLSVSAVQDVIGAAIGGRDAGMMFEGDRRFPIVVRLNDAVRENLEALKNLPVPLLPTVQTGRAPAVLLKQVARFRLSEGPNQISRENGKRRVVVTANVRGRDIASLVEEVQDKVAKEVQLPAGYWLTWGGQFENLEAARQRLMIVVPGCFFLILCCSILLLAARVTQFSYSAPFPLPLRAASSLCGCAACHFPCRPRSGLLRYLGWPC